MARSARKGRWRALAPALGAWTARSAGWGSALAEEEEGGQRNDGDQALWRTSVTDHRRAYEPAGCVGGSRSGWSDASRRRLTVSSSATDLFLQRPSSSDHTQNRSDQRAQEPVPLRASPQLRHGVSSDSQSPPCARIVWPPRPLLSDLPRIPSRVQLSSDQATTPAQDERNRPAPSSLLRVQFNIPLHNASPPAQQQHHCCLSGDAHRPAPRLSRAHPTPAQRTAGTCVSS